MLCDGGRVGLACFSIALTSCTPLFVELLVPGFNRWYVSILVLVFHLILHIQVAVLVLKNSFLRQVAVRAAFLGTVFSAGVHLAVIAPPALTPFGCYVCLLSFFHFSEFAAIAAWSPKTLSVTSFILDHSPAYKIALALSWVEFFIEWTAWPEMKTDFWSVSIFGLLLAIFGEWLRKTAMYTAAASFTHLIADEKTEDHRLVTRGVYALCRHPSYVGWFMWSVATQLVLCNPLCLLGYTVASWKFFSSRIEIEEIALLNMYRSEYVEYQKRVPTGIPFIRGYRIDE